MFWLYYIYCPLAVCICQRRMGQREGKRVDLPNVFLSCAYQTSYTSSVLCAMHVFRVRVRVPLPLPHPKKDGAEGGEKGWPAQLSPKMSLSNILYFLCVCAVCSTCVYYIYRGNTAASHCCAKVALSLLRRSCATWTISGLQKVLPSHRLILAWQPFLLSACYTISC